MHFNILIICTFLFLPMIGNAMSGSHILELFMINRVNSLDYDDINIIANVSQNWCRAAENTGAYRTEIISKHSHEEVPKVLYNGEVNEQDLVWNRYGTACCFVNITGSSSMDDDYNPTLFRIQLTKSKVNQVWDCYDLPITIFKYSIPDKDQRAGKRRLEQGSGFSKRYVFATCENNNIPIDNICITCFAPFFNHKDEACIHAFGKIIKQTPIIEYTINSKGITKKRDCFINKKLGEGPLPFIIEDELSHFIAFRFATVQDTETRKKFVFDEAAKQRVSESMLIIGCMSNQVTQEKKQLLSQ